RAIPLPDAYQRRVLLLAGRAPRSEEVEHDHLARVVLERERARAVELVGGERRGRLVDGASADVVRIAAERQHQHDDERRDAEHDRVAQPAWHQSPTVAGASTSGRVTSRRFGCGSAAITAPSPTTAPPSHSHETSG